MIKLFHRREHMPFVQIHVHYKLHSRLHPIGIVISHTEPARGFVRLREAQPREFFQQPKSVILCQRDSRLTDQIIDFDDIVVGKSQPAKKQHFFRGHLTDLGNAVAVISERFLISRLPLRERNLGDCNLLPARCRLVCFRELLDAQLRRRRGRFDVSIPSPRRHTVCGGFLVCFRGLLDAQLRRCRGRFDVSIPSPRRHSVCDGCLVCFRGRRAFVFRRTVWSLLHIKSGGGLAAADFSLV